jgi:hypothetical protein
MWDGSSGSATLLGSTPPGGQAVFTEAGLRYFGLAPQVAALPSAPLLPSLAMPTVGASIRGLEYVGVVKVLDPSDKAIIARANGEQWLLEKGVGCLGLFRFEGRQVIVTSPGLFAGVGSQLILPDGSGNCRIWNSQQLH